MRQHARITALATAVALAASSTPAFAFENRAPSGPTKAVTPVAAVQHDSGSPELVLALAAGGGIALLGSGVAVSRQRRQTARRRSPDVAAGA